MEKKRRKTGFHLDMEAGYFTNQGVDVIVFSDIYPAGHQGGVSILTHGERLAANGGARTDAEQRKRREIKWTGTHLCTTRS